MRMLTLCHLEGRRDAMKINESQVSSVDLMKDENNQVDCIALERRRGDNEDNRCA
jgi:hypothetical protein